MSTLFIAGELPVLSESQKRISKAAWKVKDRYAHLRKPSEAVVIYRSPEYQRECELRAAEHAAGKAARRAAGVAKRQATLAKKKIS